MDQWWERHNTIDRGGYGQSDVEDVTGRIPLLLDKCVVSGKIDLTMADLREIYNKAAGFALEIRARIKGEGFEWNWYLKVVTACFCHKEMPFGWPAHLDLIDRLYFYRLDNDGGRYTCGLIRDAVAEQLLEWNDNFADTGFLDSLAEFTNLSVAAFTIEHVVLSSTRLSRLAIAAGVGQPMKVQLLTGSSDIKTDITDQPVLYRPTKFNFKDIDGMIVLIKPDELNGAKKPKLLMFPFQIALVPDTRSDSHAMFFKEYEKWGNENLNKYTLLCIGNV